MSAMDFKDKVIEELELMPEETLPDLYRLVHYFRLGVLSDNFSSVQRHQEEGDVSLPDDEKVIEREQSAFTRLHPYQQINPLKSGKSIRLALSLW